ncbi:antitoxin [Arsenicicoccus sp. oral taxon 190]|uniref:antitoxin n=1 Tax=Arsenicicoccus sp. oral taxon 190 TaxID=1658671 RepID=UPI0009E65E7D|nr:antitoxin [Arsenicicoccus sp. oral taxon 190]
MVKFNDIVGKAGKAASQAAGKAKQYIEDNPDKVSGGLDKVGGLVDKGTKGRFSRQIQQGRDLAKDKLVHGSSGTSPAGQPAGTTDPTVRPTTGETFDTTTVRPDADTTGRGPGQVG